jgi:hypothetical protein
LKSDLPSRNSHDRNSILYALTLTNEHTHPTHHQCHHNDLSHFVFCVCAEQPALAAPSAPTATISLLASLLSLLSSELITSLRLYGREAAQYDGEFYRDGSPQLDFLFSFGTACHFVYISPLPRFIIDRPTRQLKTKLQE